MNSYDLNILSPIEFENLSRDLLQLKFNIYLESFSEGKDFGIDFRSSNGEIIVQCKRINEKNNLLTSLKKEYDKVIKLKPVQYIITTSLSLSVNTKNIIKNIFKELKETEILIFGSEDLNNLIRQYKQVEEDYYKLWLSNTNILKKILLGKSVNLNNFGLEKIKEKLKVYVQNKSLEQAHNLLKENNYLIISGIPGIGKTTLAEILSYSYLANGYEELIYINDNIDAGITLFDEHKSQVFLYDDFLGRNFLFNSLDKNEDKKIVDFLQLINSHCNKKLILTTREYILNQAEIRYEIIDKVELSKYILDLEKYSILDKAKILYNHFYFSNIPYEYIETIITNRKIIEVINHVNYSPRIIETLTLTKSWEEIELRNFGNYMISLLDNPYEVWLHAYENQISDISRFILNNLLLNQQIKLKKLYSVINYNYKKNNNIEITLLVFNKSIKELGNCFIKIYNNKGENEVDLYNPSIHDILVHYINSSESRLFEAFDNIYFINKINQIFSFDKIKNKIFIAPDHISDFSNLRWFKKTAHFFA